MHALDYNPNIGSLRETLFLNQLDIAGHQVTLPRYADFEVDNQYIFEIGGPSKDRRQMAGVMNSWLVIGDIEHSFLNKIPLWLFGFFY